MNTQDTHSPVTLVTGGAGGIGSALVKSLAANGHKVLFTYLESQENAAELSSTLTSYGYDVEAIQLDVRDEAAVDKMFSTAIEKYGKIDNVVNNAGAMIPCPLEKLKGAAFRTVFEINTFGALNILHNSAIHLAEGGCIVNISSTLVQAPIAGSGAYAASKAALETLAVVASKELGSRNIRVNSLRVGPTVPGMFSKSPPARQEAMAQASPFKRLGVPDDVVKVVTFLLGEGGHWITGQTLTVDGGAT